MGKDATAGSSFLLAQHDAAHREHSQQQQQQYLPQKQNHQRLHRALHKKQGLVEELVTEIVATISIIQQINVDINGNTIAIETIQTHLLPTSQLPAIVTDLPLPAPAPVPTDAPPAIPVIPIPPVLPVIPESPSQPPPSIPAELVEPPAVVPVPTEYTPSTEALPPPVAIQADSQPLSTAEPSNTTLSSLDATAIATSFTSQTTTFPSLVATLNSTSLLSILNNATQTFSNSSSTSITSSSSRSIPLLITTSRSISSSLPFTSTVPASEGGLVAGATGVGSGIVPESTGDSSSSAKSDNDGVPPTPVVVGGVIGSIAGVAVLVIAMLFILRWRKRGKGLLLLGSNSGADDGRNSDVAQPSGAMTETKSAGFVIPSAFASLAARRFSRNNEPADTTADSTEKGFYRISGRKLPSVLQTGGDGYGGPMINNQNTNANNAADAAMYRDSHAFFGGRPPPSPPLGTINRHSTGGVPIYRPSPARTPTREESPFSFPPEHTTPPPARRPDLVGRSHVSQDGSHTSRFTEEV